MPLEVLIEPGKPGQHSLPTNERQRPRQETPQLFTLHEPSSTTVLAKGLELETVPAIWIPRLAFAVGPGLLWAKWWFKMLDFCDQCMERRMKQTLDDRDIASFFIEDHSTSMDQRRKMWLSGDTATLVVAGSDTNAPTLTHLFYFLARYPEHTERIYQELQSLDSMDDVVGLPKLNHLNGAINEVMRPLPAVLTFGTRVTPPDGLTIAGTFIPGGTKICAPRYTI
ncbi:hypothetical protein AbraIFM66950_011131 [Aspergillus brasiliensis]|nr:hypothetical protein AbraIFM66950_011131 [Aspergillus brasiliensis]